MHIGQVHPEVMVDDNETVGTSDALNAEAQLSAIVEGANDAIVATGLDGLITAWSRGAERLYGYEAGEVIGQHVSLIYRVGDVGLLERLLEGIRRGEQSELIEGTRLHKDGTTVEVEVQIHPIYDDERTVIGASSIAHGLGARRRRLKELRESNEFLEHTQQVGQIGSWRTKVGPESVFTWTPETYRIFGIKQGTEVRNLDFFKLIHPDDRDLFLETLVKVRSDESRQEIELRITRLDGDLRWIFLVADVQRDDTGSVVGMAGVVQDITERKLAEARLRHDALHDQLTGLPNRTLFLDRVDQALARTPGNGSNVAVLYLDLDRFATVNEAEGNLVGDELLIEVAKRLHSSMGATDTVARFNTDEYGLVYEHIPTVSHAAELARRLLATFDEPFLLGDGGGDQERREWRITASIGVALSLPGASSEALIRDAELAMHRAKEQGRNRFELYDLALRQQVEQRFALESALRRALVNDELFLEYQPIASLSEKRFVGAEALLRWRHPELGEVQPDDFISLAEETGLIVPIGSWVLESACRQLRSWRNRPPGREDWCVSVNVAALQLRTPGFTDDVQRALEHSHLEGAALCIEITETTLVEGALVTETLDQIRSLGVRVVIDDFGMKYSSLSYLKNLAIDRLKIDRSFIENFVDDKSNRAIVVAILAIGRSLGLEVTAEGVETKGQLDELRRLGCESAQGFYFAKSLSPEECLAVFLHPPKTLGN